MILNRVSVPLLASEPILQHERRNAPITEPFRQRVALMSQAKLRVPAAGANDDHRARPFLTHGDVEREKGIVNIAAIAADDLFSLTRTSL